MMNIFLFLRKFFNLWSFRSSDSSLLYFWFYIWYNFSFLIIFKSLLYFLFFLTSLTYSRWFVTKLFKKLLIWIYYFLFYLFFLDFISCIIFFLVFFLDWLFLYLNPIFFTIMTVTYMYWYRARNLIVIFFFLVVILRLNWNIKFWILLSSSSIL